MVKMKRFITLLTAFIIALTCVSCSKKQAEFDTVLINNGAIELYDTVELNLPDIDSEAEIESSNTDVLQVIGNSVFGKKEGFSDLTVKYNGEVHKQNIVVKDLGNTPTITGENFQLLAGSSYNLAPKVLFKNTEWTDAEIIVESSDETIVKADALKVTALNQGKTNLEIKVNYAGVKDIISKTIECQVVGNDGIAVNQNIFDLYIRNEVNGELFNNTIDVGSTVYVNGEVVKNANVDWQIEDTTIATIENKTISAVKVGTTYLTGTYTNGDKIIKTLKLPVNVKIPVVRKDVDVVIDLQNENHTLDTEQIFGQNVSCGGALRSNGTEIEVLENKISTDGMSAGERTMTFYSADKTYGYVCNVVVADFVVYDKEDLNEVGKYGDKYIALAKDIDYDGDYPVVSTDYRFSGTFNGAGHSIKNISFGANSLDSCFFWEVTSGSIKNVAFKDVKVKTANGCIIAKYCTGAVTFDNVFVEATISGSPTSAIFNTVLRFPNIKVLNSIMKAEIGSSLTSEQMVDVKIGSGILAGRVTGSFEIINSYFITESLKLVGQRNNQGDNNESFETINAIQAVYANESEFISEKIKEESRINLSGFNYNWDLSGGIPIMKSAK